MSTQRGSVLTEHAAKRVLRGGLDPQGSNRAHQAFVSLAFRVAFAGDLVAILDEFLISQEALAVGAKEFQLGPGEIESNAQKWTDPAVHLGNRLQFPIVALIAGQFDFVGIVK